jgi:hypothetical protein
MLLYLSSDPSATTAFSDILYSNDDFLTSLSNALHKDGILISQIGEADGIQSPGVHFSSKVTEYEFMELLKKQGFEKMEDYNEGHGGFLAVWKYKIAFKCANCTYSRWHSNQAMIDWEIQRRSMDAVVNGSQDSLFRYFDGATMMGYQYPTRVDEEVFCRDVPIPEWCHHGHGWDPERIHVNSATLEVRPLTPATTVTMQQFTEGGIEVNTRGTMLDAFLSGYGYKSNYFGQSSYFVDSSILSIVNHGCRSTSNLQPVCTLYACFNETPTSDEFQKMFESVTYNPFISRNHLIFSAGCQSENTQDIVTGEEILNRCIDKNF